MFGSTIQRKAGSITLAAVIFLAAGCSEAEKLAEQGSDLTLPDIEVPDVDLDASDFEIPDIVASDIEVPTIEAPEVPEIRFSDAVEITVGDITIEEITVAQTDDETIYTIEGQAFFDSGKATPRVDAYPALEEILRSIQNRDYNGQVMIEGHTDSDGEAEYNQDLSVRRATGVALWFRERLPEDRDIQAVGYGETKPIARNTTEAGDDDVEGKAQNRRVEVIVSKG